MSYRTYIAASRAAYIAGIEAGISPQELRAHTGVIGEAFVAEYLGVKLTSINNQKGYDLEDPNGLRVSVKTITTSTAAELNENTTDSVDRVIVVWLDTVIDEIGIAVVYDKPVEEFILDCGEAYRGRYRLGRSAMNFPSTTKSAEKFEIGDVITFHQFDNVLIRKHSSGSFSALVAGEPQPARQYLIAIRNQMGLPEKVNDTTRSLGAQIFSSLGK